MIRKNTFHLRFLITSCYMQLMQSWYPGSYSASVLYQKWLQYQQD